MTQRPQMSTHIDPNSSSDPIISNDPTASNDLIDFSEPTAWRDPIGWQRIAMSKEQWRFVKKKGCKDS